MFAYDSDRPVGMIASYSRPYFVRDELMLVREASDWICLPEYRHLGIGVLLMSFRAWLAPAPGHQNLHAAIVN